jgi:hypothetical protein
MRRQRRPLGTGSFERQLSTTAATDVHPWWPHRCRRYMGAAHRDRWVETADVRQRSPEIAQGDPAAVAGELMASSGPRHSVVRRSAAAGRKPGMGELEAPPLVVIDVGGIGGV